MRTLGTAKVCITPKRPVRLCGFGFRSGPYDAVRKDIFVRIFDLREDGHRVVFIYGDLLWWNPVFVARMRREMEAPMLFAASHNHSGPGTGDSFIPLLETVDGDYADFLARQIRLGMHLAQENMEEVVLRRSEGECALNVYRRVLTEDGIRMMPNYDVQPDRTLTVLGFYRPDGSLKGRIVHYPCHANLSKDNELHPDYPGYALERMDENDPGSVSLFLQGCTADLRPNCVLGSQFRAGSAQDVEAFADQFLEAVERTVRREITVGPGMSLNQVQIRLPVVQERTKEEAAASLEDEREEVRQWAGKTLEKGFPGYEVLELSALVLGEQKCCFFNAEVAMYYAEMARTLCPGVVCAGYTNGMIGYLSTAQQIREGGYEPCESAVYFAVAGTYGEAIQQRIEAALRKLLYVGEKEETDERGTFDGFIL